MLAIHTKSGSFWRDWVAYCDEKRLAYKEVDCLRSDIMEQLSDCSALMWHWVHHDQSAALFARQLTLSLEKMGKMVFPDSATSWHYDDKVAQKYLLEAIGAPLVPTWIFYRPDEALAWANRATYPVVFKLRSGAGSTNVRLVKTPREACKLIHRSFGVGWSGAGSPLGPIKERLWHMRRDRNLSSVMNLGRGVYRAIKPHSDYRRAPRHSGYAYFQQFLHDNDHDIRVIVIGDRAFAIKRMAREHDFRASGSGMIIYDRDRIPTTCVQIAFEVTKALGAQSVAYDFMFKDGAPMIGEISYAFTQKAYEKCPGWWDSRLDWHEGSVRPAYFMIEDLLRATEARAS